MASTLGRGPFPVPRPSMISPSPPAGPPGRARSPDEPPQTGPRRGIGRGAALGMLRAQAGLVSLMAILGLAGGITYQARRLPVYVSTAELLVDPRDMQASAGGAPVDTDALVGNAMRVLTSNTLLGALIDQQALAADPAFLPRPSPLAELRRALDDSLGHAPPPPASGDIRRQVLDTLGTRVAVQRADRSSVVEVSVRSADAAQAARLANGLVTLYIAQALAAASELNRRIVDTLQNRLADVGAQLRDADDRLAQFRIDNHLLEPPGGPTSVPRAMPEQPTIARVRAGNDWVKPDGPDVPPPKAAAPWSAPEAVPSPAVAQLQAQLAEAVRKQAALGRQLGPRHPDMLAASREVEATRQRLASASRRSGPTPRSQDGGWYETPAKPRQEADPLWTASTPNDGAATARLRVLEGEAEVARTLYTSFLTRSRELDTPTAVYTSSSRQIGTALPALASATLPGPVVIAVSLLLGLVGGLVLAGLLEATRSNRAFSGAVSRGDR